MRKIVIRFFKKNINLNTVPYFKDKESEFKRINKFHSKLDKPLASGLHLNDIREKSRQVKTAHVRCFHSINSVHHKNRKTTSTKTGHLLMKPVYCSYLVTNSWVATLSIDAQHFFYFRILLINFFIYRVEDSLEKNAEPHRQRKTFEKRLNRSIISL